MRRKKFRIVSFYDTETCNIGAGVDTQAYVVLYIFNNIDCPIQFYEGEENDNIYYYRYTGEAILVNLVLSLLYVATIFYLTSKA